MNNDQLLIDQFLSNHSDIAVAAIEELETEEISLLLENSSLDQALVILSKLVPYKAGKVLENANVEAAIEWIDHLPLSNAESILRICEKHVSDQILSQIQSERAKFLKRALSYSKDQVGAHLMPDVFTLHESMKVEKALQLIKSCKALIKPNVFVLNEDNKLVGFLEVNELITNQPEKGIKSLIKTVSKTVLADMSAKDLLDDWDHAFIDLPVVKMNGEFIGIVSKTSLTTHKSGKSAIDYSLVKAGNALGELYIIGLTSLLGSAEPHLKS